MVAVTGSQSQLLSIEYSTYTKNDIISDIIKSSNSFTYPLKPLFIDYIICELSIKCLQVCNWQLKSYIL